MNLLSTGLARTMWCLFGLCLMATISGAADIPDSVNGLIDLNGNAVEWMGEVEGEASVILVTAHECPVANRSIPDLNALHKAFAAKGVAFLILYTDPEAPVETVRKHYKAYSIAAPALMDPGHVLVRKLEAKMTPEAFVFDGKGRLVYRGRINDRFSGFGESRPAATRHDVKEVLEALLDGSRLTYREEPGFGCRLLIQTPEPE